MRVFLTGATGLIGRALAVSLLHDGHEVVALSRSASPAGLPVGSRLVQGDPAVAGPWQDELSRCDACVNLAGEPVAAGRWTGERKRRIRDSRVLATRNVAQVVAGGGPSVLVNGSAIGFYGPGGDDPVDESAPPGHDFLSDVAVEWEEAARPAQQRARLVLVRTGIVLAGDGGALPKLVLPFRMFAGGPIGDGGFWQSWIHLADQVGILRLALEDPRASGPVNATAPEPVRNRDLAGAIGRVLRRPGRLVTPAFAIRAALGEMAEVVLGSQRVVPARALSLGYRFRWPALEPALRDLLHQEQKR
jgi:uncharacterized protein (TIGR01777 family)